MYRYSSAEVTEIMNRIAEAPLFFGRELFVKGNYPQAHYAHNNPFNEEDVNEAAKKFAAINDPKEIVSLFVARYVPYGSDEQNAGWWLEEDTIYAFIALGAIASVLQHGEPEENPPDYRRSVAVYDLIAQVVQDDNDFDMHGTLIMGMHRLLQLTVDC